MRPVGEGVAPLFLVEAFLHLRKFPFAPFFEPVLPALP